MEKKYVFGWQRMGTIRLEVCGDGRHLRASINREENWDKELPTREEEQQQWEMGFLDFLEKQDCESL
jgi:hypothetical protein